MVEIKKSRFEGGSQEDIKDVKDLAEWCKSLEGSIKNGVCIHEGSEIAFDDRITIKLPYGVHIPLKDAQGNKGNTKNIGYIGARTVFGVDFDTAKVNYDAITNEKMLDEWQRELKLYISQKRNQQEINRSIQLADMAGLTLAVPSLAEHLKAEAKKERIYHMGGPRLK